MALESVSNVKNVPSHFNGKKGDDALKAAHLESSIDDGDEEDLEDGEILDDEEEVCTPSTVPIATQPETVNSTDNKLEKKKPAQSSENRSSRRKPEDDDEGRHKRDRHKRHKKRHREGEEETARDGKRTKRSSAPSRQERQSEEDHPYNDEEMLFIRGASPTCAQHSPTTQERFSQFAEEAGHYEQDSDSDPDSPHFRMESNRGSTNRRRGSGGPRNAGRIADRLGGSSKKRKEKGSSRRGANHLEVKKRECMFYAQGKCQKGDDCPYLHTICPQRKLELCKFYLMDCCAKKDKCLYMHSDFPCKFYHTGMKCFSGERCKFSHDPLTETSRQILLKHIETAPKEILGEFPRLPRDNSGEVILPELKIGDENGSSHQSSLISSVQQKKIPSLFEIEIKPPPELSNLLNEGQGNRTETESEKEQTELRQMKNSNRHHISNRPGVFYHERNHSSHSEEDNEDDEEEEDSEEDNFETQLRKCMEAQRLERERKERDDAAHVPIGNLKVETVEEELQINITNKHIKIETEKIKEKEKTPPKQNVGFYSESEKEPEQSEVAAEAERHRRQLEEEEEAQEEDEDEDEDQLVMATLDEDDSEYEEDEENKQQSLSDVKASDSGAEEETEEGVSIPKHLPKKQRELFLRIQQQQAQRAAAAAAEALEAAEAKAKQEDDDDVDQQQENKELEEDITEYSQDEGSSLPARDENWYSSDDEQEEEKSLMKNILHNLSKQPSAQGSPVADTTESSSSGGKPADTVISSTTTSSGMLDTLNLANINITDDISRLLNTIRSSTGKSETKPTTRDPRLSRDPRSRECNPSSPSVQSESTSTSKITDTDLRMLPNSSKDLDLRNPSSSNTGAQLDIDLRQRCFGDTDLRSVPILGLPFKPVPLHVPCTEIEASISSHPPVQFQLLPAEVKCPDYSDLKLDFTDPHVRNDPRLKNLVAQSDATISPMSPPPCEAPRTDPRSRSASSDPRLARGSSATTTVIPINQTVTIIPTGNEMESAGLIRAQNNVLVPQSISNVNQPMGGQNIMHQRTGLLENPMLNRSEAPGLLGISPMHSIMIDVNMGLKEQVIMHRKGLLGPAPGILCVQKDDDYESHKNYGGGEFKSPRSRGRGGGNWERRGSRSRGPRSGNWDRDRRRNRRDFNRHDRHDRQYSPPTRRGSRQYSPGRNERYNSPSRDDWRSKYSPARDTRAVSPQRGHSKSNAFIPSDSGSFTPPRKTCESYTPPENESGSFTPPQ